MSIQNGEQELMLGKTGLKVLRNDQSVLVGEETFSRYTIKTVEFSVEISFSSGENEKIVLPNDKSRSKQSENISSNQHRSTVHSL